MSEATLASGVTVPVAQWVIRENAKPGTNQWILTAPSNLFGFADQVSAVTGETVTLFINSPGTPVRVKLYRMGWYGGAGGRLIWQSSEIPAQPQPPPSFTSGINMIECHWQPSLKVHLAQTWPTGMYLFRLIAADGSAQGHIPLCIRDDSNHAAFAIMNAVTNWQAYNTYGGYSLYTSPSGAQNRSRVVSFDRPYQNPDTASNFLGNEFPVILMAERLGLDITYLTSIDLHEQPQQILRNRCLFSLGHDEYWSSVMRAGATNAADKGVNLAFLGANAIYRHIRLQSSPLGANRQQVCYKTDFMTEDPMWGVNPAEVTANWPDGPDPRPEQELIGSEYQDVEANADVVIVDPTAWIFNGMGLKAGQVIPRALQGEYDHYEPSLGTPQNVTILAHSPVTNRASGAVSDMTYYTRGSGGGVFATGNAAFVGQMTDAPSIQSVMQPFESSVTPLFERMMENVFSVFGAGPASQSQPSTANWQNFYG